jgi:hypothetical protein
VTLPRYAEVRRRADAEARQKAQAANAKVFVAPAELLGEWSGTLRTWERTIPMTLTVQPDGDVHVRLEGGLEALVNGARWDENNLTGRFAGTIPTNDASRWPHYIELSLRLRQGTLTGMASAVTTTE